MKKEVFLPDIGNFKDVDVIEVLVAPGDRVERESGLLVLESDKATMEVPSPDEGVIAMVKVKVGDKVSRGGLLLAMEVADTDDGINPQPELVPKTTPVPENSSVAPKLEPHPPPATPNRETTPQVVHASPSIRRYARELGVDLGQVRGSGIKGRITQDDVRNHVKTVLTTATVATASTFHGETRIGIRWPDLPVVDFAAFGPVKIQPLSRIQRLSGPNVHRNAVTIPHVTQFDEADITELESFRHAVQSGNFPSDEAGPRLTLLAFLMKGTVAALRRYPQFNSSLDESGENLILKDYFHIGVAVDTSHGLVVPVIREVDRKGLRDLATELATMSEKARARKLLPDDLQGGCFTLSSLGSIGGGHFTPIINGPEVAILGIGRATTKPLWRDNAFIPRLMLPLSLSYDHRVIDGAAGVRFIIYLAQLLQDIRQLLL
ncbi:pyruvate dehydrogenase E2 component (dihydrolipoamide acetyltransferase) [Gammaproteobacteria bacterium]